MTRSAPFALAATLGAALATTGLAAQSKAGHGSIPAHPSRLEFPQRVVEIPRAEPLIHRLSSGIPVVVVEDHSLPLVDVTFAILAGSYLDPTDKPGVAELTGAMLRRGGTLERDPGSFDDAIDFLGAEMNSRATGTRAGASLDCLSETLEECLGLFFEMLRRPAFDKARLDGIRTNLLTSFAARNDDAIDLMEREWSVLLAGETSYLSRQLSADDIQAIGRQDLIDFQRRYWRPERGVIAVSGDVATDRVLALLETEVRRWTADLAVGDQVADSVPTPWPPDANASPSSAGVYQVDHPTPQAKVSIGKPIEPIVDWLSKEALALEVANEILGGTTGLVSRINGRLRGQGWVYRALSELDAGRYEPGSFRIFLDALPGNVSQAVAACLEEIERMGSSTVDPRELEIVKGEFLSGLVLRFDTAQEVAGYFAEDLLLGRPHEYWYTYPERLSAIGRQDIRSAARRHLDPASLRVLVVGGAAPLPERTSNPLLTRWLREPNLLPPRNPMTLEPLADMPNGPE